MAFDSLADFMAMGSHGPYVWSAWGVTLGLLVVCVMMVRGESRAVRRTLRRRLRRDAVAASTSSEASHEG